MKINILNDFTFGIGFGLMKATGTPQIIEPLCRNDGKWTEGLLHNLPNKQV